MQRKRGHKQKDIKPLSSNSAFEVIDSTGTNLLGFSAFADESSRFPSDPMEFHLKVLLRKLAKKDPTSKVKALQQICEIIPKENTESCVIFFKYWIKVFPKLCINSSKQVREHTQNANLTILSSIKDTDELSKLIHSITPYMVISLCDAFKPSSIKARNAMNLLCTQSKCTSLLFDSREKITHDIFSVTIQHVSQLSGKDVNEEDKVISADVVCQCLSSLIVFLSLIDKASVGDTCMLFSKLMEDKAFWSLAKQDDASVKVAFYKFLYGVIEACPRVIDAHKKNCFSAVFNALNDSAHDVCSITWKLAHTIIRSFDDLWNHISFSKNFVPKLQYVLRSGCVQCADVFDYLPEIFPLFPVIENKPEFCDKILDSFILGTKNLKPVYQKSLLTSLFASYFTCLKYLLLRRFSEDAEIFHDLISKHVFVLMNSMFANSEMDNCFEAIAQNFSEIVLSTQTGEDEPSSLFSNELCGHFSLLLNEIDNDRKREKICSFLYPCIKPHPKTSAAFNFIGVFISFMLNEFNKFLATGDNVEMINPFMYFLGQLSIDSKHRDVSVITVLCQNENIRCRDFYDAVIKPIYKMKNAHTSLTKNTARVAVYLIFLFDADAEQEAEMKDLGELSASSELCYNFFETSTLFPKLFQYCLSQQFVHSKKFLNLLESPLLYTFDDKKANFDVLKKIVLLKGPTLNEVQWKTIVDSCAAFLIKINDGSCENSLKDLFDAFKSNITPTEELMQCIFLHVVSNLNLPSANPLFTSQFSDLWIHLVSRCEDELLADILCFYFDYVVQYVDSQQKAENSVLVFQNLLTATSAVESDKFVWKSDFEAVDVEMAQNSVGRITYLFCKQVWSNFRDLCFNCCLTVCRYNSFHCAGCKKVDASDASQYFYVFKFIMDSLKFIMQHLHVDSWKNIDAVFLKTLSILINYAIYMQDFNFVGHSGAYNSSLTSVLHQIPIDYITQTVETHCAFLSESWFIVTVNYMNRFAAAFNDAEHKFMNKWFDIMSPAECDVTASYLTLFSDVSQDIVEDFLQKVASALLKDCSAATCASYAYSLVRVHEILQPNLRENFISVCLDVFDRIFKHLPDVIDSSDNYWTHYHLIHFMRICLQMPEYKLFNFDLCLSQIFDYIYVLLEETMSVPLNLFANCSVNSCAAEIFVLIRTLLKDEEMFTVFNESSRGSVLKVFSIILKAFLCEMGSNYLFQRTCETLLHVELCNAVRSMDFSLFTRIPEPNQLFSEDKDCILSKDSQFTLNKVFMNMLNKPFCYVALSYEIIDQALALEAKNLPENLDGDKVLTLPLVFRLLLHSDEFMRSFNALSLALDGDLQDERLHIERVASELIVYKLILSLYRNIPNSYKSSLIAHLMAENLFDTFLLKLVTILSAKPLTFTYDDVDVDVPFSDCINFEGLTKLAYSLCFESFAVMPKLMRDTFGHYSKHEKKLIDNFLVRHVCPILIRLELAHISNSASEFPSETLKIQVAPTLKRVTATHIFADSQIHIILTFPPNYPLQSIEATLGNQTAVKKSESRKWMLILIRNLCDENCSVYDAILQMKKNIDKKFEGVEECPICYFVIHRSIRQLPKTECRTCHKKFHTICLFKWFDSSGRSTCPHCRAEF